MKHRLISVDVVRVIAMLMVLVMHTMLSFTLRPDFFPSKLWFALEPIVAVSHTCVLLFFMLSGYLILPKERSIGDTMRRLFHRIIVPLVVFELTNSAYLYHRIHLSYPHISVFFFDEIKRFFGYPSSPLWFLVVLVFLYLLTPLLSRLFTDMKNKKLAIYITAITFVFSLIFTGYAYVVGKTADNLNNFTAWTTFIRFYLYGGLVRNKWIPFSNSKINLILLLLGLTLTMGGDYFGMSLRISQNNSSLPMYSQSYTGLPIVLIAITLFNILMSYNFSFGKRTLRMIQGLAGLSFGTYLIHPYVVSLFSDILQFDFDHLSMNVYLYNIVNYGLVLGISAMVTAVILSIPKLRIIIGEK